MGASAWPDLAVGVVYKLIGGQQRWCNDGAPWHYVGNSDGEGLRFDSNGDVAVDPNNELMVDCSVSPGYWRSSVIDLPSGASGVSGEQMVSRCTSAGLDSPSAFTRGRRRSSNEL